MPQWVETGYVQWQSDCHFCNLAKSDRTAGRDPVTGTTVALFNPRSQMWSDHFRWEEDLETLAGLTATGRATVVALDMNSALRKGARQLWFATGWLP